MSNLSGAFTSWWNGTSLREKRLVIICLVLFIFGAVYWNVIQPMSERAQQAQSDIATQKQLLHWMKQKADRITQLRGSGGMTASAQPLNQIISASTKRYKVELIRIQPRDEMLQVWVKPVQFDYLVNWLAYLQQDQGVQVEFMDISAGDVKGVVEVKRLQLRRGG